MIDVHSLKVLFNDDVLVQKYLKRFKEDMPILLVQIRTAYAAKQWNELSIHAHTYRSQLQYVHESLAANIAYELENISSSSLPEAVDVDKLIVQLEDQLGTMLQEIKQVIE